MKATAFVKRFIWHIISFVITILNGFVEKIKKKTDDIVIIRFDRIGDFVIWLGTAKYLQEIYKNRNLTLICMPYNKELAEEVGYFHKVITCDASIVSIFKTMFGMKANLLLHPTYSRDFLSELAAKLIVASEKIAIDGDTSNCSINMKKYFDKTYSHLIETPQGVLMELKRNQYFINSLGSKSFPATIADFSTFLTHKEKEKTYFLINLGASAGYRQWPVERFCQVAEYIYKKTKWFCVLCGGSAEADLAELFLEKYPYMVKNFVGKTTVREVVDLVGHAMLVLCNDTSTVHIAAACKVQSFCIAPGLHYPRFVPYVVDDPALYLPTVITSEDVCFGCGNSETARKQRKIECCSAMEGKGLLSCISKVSAEQVIEKVSEYLAVRKGE